MPSTDGGWARVGRIGCRYRPQLGIRIASATWSPSSIIGLNRTASAPSNTSYRPRAIGSAYSRARPASHANDFSCPTTPRPGVTSCTTRARPGITAHSMPAAVTRSATSACAVITTSCPRRWSSAATPLKGAMSPVDPALATTTLMFPPGPCS
ncbi:MAG: hypothetical protein ACOH16_09260 [Propionibacteriaceae bacterium]